MVPYESSGVLLGRAILTRNTDEVQRPNVDIGQAKEMKNSFFNFFSKTMRTYLMHTHYTLLQNYQYINYTVGKMLTIMDGLNCGFIFAKCTCFRTFDLGACGGPDNKPVW